MREEAIPSDVRIRGSVVWVVWIINAIGASFCQVDKISPVNRSNP